MKGFGECQECGGLYYLPGHKCKDKWWVSISPTDPNRSGETPTLVKARTARDAAEEYVEEWDRADCKLLVVTGKVVFTYQAEEQSQEPR